MGKTQSLKSADIARLIAATHEIHVPCPVSEFLARATAVLGRLVSARAGHGTMLRLASSHTPAVHEGSIHYGMSDAAVKNYMASHASRDPGLKWLARQRTPVLNYFPRLVLTPDEQRSHPVLETIYKPHGLEDGAAICLAIDPRRLMLISCHFDHAADRREMELIRLFTPQFVRSARVKAALARSESGLDATTAVFVFDRAGRGVFANSAARRLMGDAPDHDTAREGSVWNELKTLARSLFERHRYRTLHELDNPLLLGSLRRVGFTFEEPDANGDPQTVAIIVRRPVRLPGPEHWMSTSSESIEPGIRPVLEAVGATPGELEIAEMLWQGKCEREVAAAIGRSLSAVKHRSGNLFRRCGATRRSEWMAWVSTQLMAAG